MKIFSFFNNYSSAQSPAHQPDWMLLPDSVLLRSGKHLYLPGDDGEMLGFPSLCLKIGRLGKSVGQRFAYRYFSEIAPAVQFFSKNCLNRTLNGFPPRAEEIIFDGAIMIGEFITLENISHNDDLAVSCSSPIFSSINNNEFKEVWQLNNLKSGIPQLLEIVSSANTIKMGDLLLAGINPDGIPALREESVKLNINDKNLLSFKIK
ncbi:MAG: fumarylacetoacetate hydrolase family protein [Muribaculaceae bacterium]|nr:fumarylacetoacetate hydrolase family protein [Muribaculaceae bacterium]